MELIMMEALTLQSTEGTWSASVVALTVLRLLDRTQHLMLCAISHSDHSWASFVANARVILVRRCS